MNGRISKFTIDKLVNMAARVGLHADVTIRQICMATGGPPAPTQVSHRHGGRT